jgi:hypothetical protein
VRERVVLSGIAYHRKYKSMLKHSPRRISGNFVDRLQAILQSPLMSVVYLISAILSLFSGHGFWALMFLVSCVYSNPALIWQLQNQYRDWLRQHQLNPVMLTGVMFGLLAGVVLGLAIVEPSHAQFFGNAQRFIEGNFNQGLGSNGNSGAISSVIGLVMNTLRLLFVMYVLFGIVQVFNAVRQGEEWKDLAKTPFFVVLAGTLGDVLVGAIVGTGTGTTIGLPR